jgi:hypothetical protein
LRKRSAKAKRIDEQRSAKAKAKRIDEQRIRDCYWLAHFYCENPARFLSEPPAAIRQHMKYSKELYRRIKLESKS